MTQGLRVAWAPVGAGSAAASPISPEAIAELGATCLRLEVETWPKPGLVSAVDTGSHDDMDAGTFARSAAAIRPYLAELAAAGAARAEMAVLRRIGLRAEHAMLAATGGVNTHRGAIFGLGLLCAAAGLRASGMPASRAPAPGASGTGAPALNASVSGASAPGTYGVGASTSSASTAGGSFCGASVPGAFASGASPVGGSAPGGSPSGAVPTLGEIVARQWGAEIVVGPRASDSHGEIAVRRHGVGGARQEAASGFPSVYRIGLPALCEAQALRPGDAPAARVQACFALIASVADTNLLHRGGAGGLAFAQRRARDFLARGGIGAPDWLARAEAVHRAFVVRRLSPGGAADLLAMSLFAAASEAP
ncbi:triphosphoribosyl-dephospho-CoA synthase [Burkholderia plantarii]|uniref:triphosphoribosyl-dephospho-CoA synthase n=1 Tax=Burkholderia plantarii TaxID=41899 RepID=UPI00272D186D|nr:triphosphoribosyl-dephospho-CoA synthase [Burkholderia plantarii]WLE58732.1 triphosphoribosyl-dephospho-CoA synthase [Burkholderia plantarii]